MNIIRKWTLTLALTTMLAAAVTTQSAQAQSVQTKNPDTFTSLYGFGDFGNTPVTGLIQATNGNLYGTTTGGPSDASIYALTFSGTLTFTTFFPGNGYSGLPIQATDGSLYWTNFNPLAGEVFKATLGGKTYQFSTFYCTEAGCADGANPVLGPLVQASNGDFYGTASMGGVNNGGTVFKMGPLGKLTPLYSFCIQTDCTDGEYPYAGLLQATNGDFYGTTFEGGAHGDGTVFKITANGTLTTLYSFCSQTDCTDGESPYAGLIQGTNGDFYGTTSRGGANGSYGTVFKITAKGTLTTLYSFCSQADCTDGEYPYAGLIQATNGDFYGTTASGGAHDGGTVFKITASGKLTTLYSFCSQLNSYGVCTDGQTPYAGLLQATSGTFYGTTVMGGGGTTEGSGTVFSLSVGLGPFVALQTNFGAAGGAVTILGTDLTGATGVTFNGTAATFTVNSTGTAISTTVPTGATTGTVQVVTPAGTLSSSGVYTVVTSEPVLSLATGTYSGPQTVSITDATGGAAIYYTTNGKNPTTASSVYTGPITVSSSETLKANAIASGCAPSAIASAVYTVRAVR